MCFDQEKTSVAEPDYRLNREHRSYRDAGHAVPMGTESCAGNLARPMSDSEVLTELFKYHPPTPEQLPKYAAINQAAKNLAEVILQNCPSSADRSAAIRLIRDARMTANASVALNGLSL